MSKQNLFSVKVMNLVDFINRDNYETTKAVTPEALNECIFCKAGAGLRAYFKYTEDQSEIDEYVFPLCQPCYASRIASKSLNELTHLIPLFKIKEAQGLDMTSTGWAEYHSDKLHGHLDKDNIASHYVIFTAGVD